MSMPAMSYIVNGPIAMPNAYSALSTCCGDAPSSTRNSDWRMYCSSIRLPMKPSHTPETTATFFRRLPSCITVASTSFDVFAPRTTSSSRITLAGLKKWVPMTSCGREVAAAIWSTSSVDVLVARIAPRFIVESRRENRSCLTIMSS